MEGGTNSSEFRIPDSELEGSVELRVPSPKPLGLTPVPSDKILFPRRMLYVEAALYATLAITAFGLGYLAGRGGWSAANKENAENADVQKRVPVEGRVMLVPLAGAKRGDDGAAVIVLPAGRLPAKPLPLAGLRPDDPPLAAGDATAATLADFGGAAARATASGEFTVFAPAAGSYRVLVLSRHADREPNGPLERNDFAELGKYFDSPANLLQRHRYRWLTKDIRRDGEPIEIEFSE